MSYASRAWVALAWLCAACSPVRPNAAPPPPVLEEIHTTPAILRPIQDELVASGNITADPARQGQVGAPAAGRLTDILVHPGERVQAGQALARLHSPDLTRARAAHQDAMLRLQLAQRTLEQRRQLYRLGDTALRPVEEARNELSSATSDLEISRSNHVLARKKLDRARDLHGHGIATQQELEEAEAAFEQSHSRVEQSQRQLGVALQHRQREERLAASGSLSAPRILEAENELALAREEVAHTGEILRDLGIGPDEDGLLLRASRAGILVSSQAALGQAVTADQPLFEILDPRRLWLWIYVHESDQRRVKLGQKVSVEVEALPGRHFSGRISYLPPQVELPSRALRCRVVVDNPQLQLKVGMAARVRLAVAAPHQGVTVPLSALQGDRVFVGGSSGYQARPVVTGLRRQDWVEITRGLRAGEEVVSAGAELLR
jgi:cobalt-zinc-cadmium efflux system membrane fusion protein